MTADIRFYNETEQTFPVEEDTAVRVMSQTLRDQGYDDVDVTVIALSRDDLAAMKEDYFHEAVDTDVITFTLESQPVLEGEIYCGPEQIARNAEEFKQPFHREFMRILIHGCCHLSGQEDASPEDRAEMTRLENHYLTQYYDPLCH